ncbi:MAG: hypothetical protein DME50_10970 [Verrucomicrobia bacterium]|nr:MAG: hypothetical protein DME50_10970 [Verrucomicrobiota bacterium]
MTISYESWKADKYVRIESDVKLISQMQAIMQMIDLNPDRFTIIIDGEPSVAVTGHRRVRAALKGILRNLVQAPGRD